MSTAYNINLLLSVVNNKISSCILSMAYATGGTVPFASSADAVPRRVANVGDDLCFDDWCVAVADVKRTIVDKLASYDVTIRLSTHAGGRVQRANGAAVYMTDASGRLDRPANDVPQAWRNRDGEKTFPVTGRCPLPRHRIPSWRRRNAWLVHHRPGTAAISQTSNCSGPVGLVENFDDMRDALTPAVHLRAGLQLHHAAGVGGDDHVRIHGIHVTHLLFE